jgi:hypothetical protein
MTPRNTKRQRLESAGYRCIKDAWVPEPYWRKVMQQVAFHAEDVAKVAGTVKKSGRPRKKPIAET